MGLQITKGSLKERACIGATIFSSFGHFTSFLLHLIYINKFRGKNHHSHTCPIMITKKFDVPANLHCSTAHQQHYYAHHYETSIILFVQIALFIHGEHNDE